VIEGSFTITPEKNTTRNYVIKAVVCLKIQHLLSYFLTAFEFQLKRTSVKLGEVLQSILNYHLEVWLTSSASQDVACTPIALRSLSLKSSTELSD